MEDEIRMLMAKMLQYYIDEKEKIGLVTGGGNPKVFDLKGLITRLQDYHKILTAEIGVKKENV